MSDRELLQGEDSLNMFEVAVYHWVRYFRPSDKDVAKLCERSQKKGYGGLVSQLVNGLLKSGLVVYSKGTYKVK